MTVAVNQARGEYMVRQVDAMAGIIGLQGLFPWQDIDDGAVANGDGVVGQYRAGGLHRDNPGGADQGVDGLWLWHSVVSAFDRRCQYGLYGAGGGKRWVGQRFACRCPGCSAKYNDIAAL